MKPIRLFIGTCIAASLLSSCANRNINKGHTAYNNLAYAEAVEHYTKVDDDNKDYQTKVQLADSYHFLNRPEDAAKWYAEALQEKDLSQVDYDVLIRYAQALESTGSYDLAQDYYLEAFSRNPEDVAALSRFVSSDTNQISSFETDRFETQKLAINQDNRSHMSPVYHKDGLVFTSERNKSLKNDTHPWSGRPFAEMYFSSIKEDGELGTPKVFAKNLQTPYDDGVVSFSPDGRTMYFTRTNYTDGDLNMDEEGNVNLKILKSEFKNDEWQEPQELAFNSDDYNCVHPAVSPDGTKLYFVSDMPGGIGQSDIYIANIYEDGTTGFPRNLGYVVNTERNDMFPMVKTDNGQDVLYFSSEGHPGYGGMDIFVSHSYGTGNYWTTPEALPMPLNSNKDDFGIAFEGDMDKGYLSSNRGDSQGIDALYKFDKQKEGILQAVVLEENSNEPISNSEVKLVAGEEEIVKKTGTNGSVFFEVEPEIYYQLKVEQEGFVPEEAYVVPNSSDLYGDTLVKTIDLAAIPKIVVTPIPDFRPIYYEFDDYTITEKAASELDKVATIMKDYPSITVRLNGHADSRGSDDYNDWLSAQRSEAAKAYLVNAGISASRIDTESYGEDKLVNNCDEATDDCTENQHQKNRRTVIEINSSDVSINK